MSPRQPIRELDRDNWAGTMCQNIQAPGVRIIGFGYNGHQIDTMAGTTVRTFDGRYTGAGTVEQKWVQWSPDCCLSSVVMVNTVPKLFLIKSVSPNDNVTLATVSKLKCIPIATSPLHPTTTNLAVLTSHKITQELHL